MLQGLFRNYHEIAIYDLRDFYDFVRFRGHEHTHGASARAGCASCRHGGGPCAASLLHVGICMK